MTRHHNPAQQNLPDLLLDDVPPAEQTQTVTTAVNNISRQESYVDQLAVLDPDHGDMEVDGNGLASMDESNLSPREETVVIAVMGVTGSGKSTFISLLAEQDVGVGHGLSSSTPEIGVYSYAYSKTKTVLLVDTPGFSDTSRTDAEILKDIAYFMSKMYVEYWRLVGVIYLHRITDPRMGGSALKNLHIFQKLCGTRSLSSVILTTTMWSNLEQSDAGQQIGLKRQNELQHSQFWGPLIQAGSRIVEHDGSMQSARGIVSLLVEKNAEVVLDIVQQLVREEKPLNDTEAGKFLQKDLLEAKKKFDKDIAELQDSMEEAIKERDEETLQAVQKERARAEATYQQQAREVQGLEMSMDQLLDSRRQHFRSLTANIEQRPTVDHQHPGNFAREQRIKELELMLQQTQRQHAENLARQQVEIQSQTTAQLQQIRQMVEESARQKRSLQKRLDQERRMRREDQRYSNPIMAFFKDMVGYSDEPRPKRRRHRERSEREDYYDRDLIY